MSYIAKLFLFITGWSYQGQPYNEIKKKLFVVMPHTSNWDYPVGMMVKLACKMKLNYLGKATLFKPPIGWFIKLMGGVPVDRSKNNRMVDSIIDLFNTEDKLSMVITPEGTRKKVTSLKKGFYYVAVGANVPIVFVSFDYKKKVVRFREPFMASDNYTADMAKILPFFEGTVGKIEKYNSLNGLEY